MKVVIDLNFFGHCCVHTDRVFCRRNETGIFKSLFDKILDLSEVYQTNDISFVLDSVHSFRKKLFPAYKQKRKESRQEMSEEDKRKMRSMFKQMDQIPRALEMLGFNNVFLQNGLEGDDLMAMICQMFPDEKIVLMANDHDLYQLLSKNVSLLPFASEGYIGKEFRLKDFIEQFGIQPVDWKNVKAIAGCTSDEVPGVGRDWNGNIVARIGEKTACQYLTGELGRNTKAFQRIVSPEGVERRNFNLKLVELPHIRTKSLDFKRNRISKQNIQLFLDEFQFEDYMYEREDEIDRLIRW